MSDDLWQRAYAVAWALKQSGGRGVCVCVSQEIEHEVEAFIEHHEYGEFGAVAKGTGDTVSEALEALLANCKAKGFME